MRHLAIAFGLLLVVAGCGLGGPAASPAPTGTPGMTGTAAVVRYVALGDSFTIGTSVEEEDRWPNQLVARLPQLHLVANLGVNGFTTRDVIEKELDLVPALAPDVVTLLIGVNDVVQGVEEAPYREQVAVILDELARIVGPERVLVVTTPDYTVTPAGADYGDPAKQAARIRRYNAINTELAVERGITVVDIYDLSLRAANNRALVAEDGLHPSGAQYGLWVERILPAMETLLGR